MDGESEATVLDKDDDGLLDSNKMSVVYDDSAKCSLKIKSVTEEHLGTWSCTLVDQTGGLFSGKIELSTIDSECSVTNLHFLSNLRPLVPNISFIFETRFNFRNSTDRLLWHWRRPENLLHGNF